MPSGAKRINTDYSLQPQMIEKTFTILLVTSRTIIALHSHFKPAAGDPRGDTTQRGGCTADIRIH